MYANVGKLIAASIGLALAGSVMLACGSTDDARDPTKEDLLIKDIASMPSRDQLIAKLLFLLQSPITGFVRVLAAVPQSFVMVLDQVRIKKEAAETPATPEAPAEQA